MDRGREKSQFSKKLLEFLEFLRYSMCFWIVGVFIIEVGGVRDESLGNVGFLEN